MGWFKCRCGNELPLKTGEEDHEKVLLKRRLLNKILDDVAGMLNHAKPPQEVLDLRPDRWLPLSDHYEAKIAEEFQAALHCPDCERLWLFGENGDMTPYKRESDFAQDN